MTEPTIDYALFLNQRRALLAQHPQLVGLDYIEVRFVGGGHWELLLNFVPATTPELAAIKTDTIRRIAAPNLRLTSLAAQPGQASGAVELDWTLRPFISPPNQLTQTRQVDVQLRAGELAELGPAVSGTYQLELVNMPAVDPFFAAAPFSLAAGPTSLDPRALSSASPQPHKSPAIDYLSKDYASFRRLMLDNLAMLLPSWPERHAADLGVMLVEVLAYAGDYLSYYQDAAGSEAYLTTARRRISLRRHARLLDYMPDEGCNTRVWVQVAVDGDDVPLAAHTVLLTRTNWRGAAIPLEEAPRLLTPDVRVFETMYEVMLYTEHNRMPFYTWGADEYVLRRGATEAALTGDFPHLRLGDVLVLASGSVQPGVQPTNERRQYHPVRLGQQPRLTTDALTGQSITVIHWSQGDALPFDLVVLATPPADDDDSRAAVLGNVVLADYGLTGDEQLTPVPLSGPYTPQLFRTGLTYSVPFDKDAHLSAAAMQRQVSLAAMPAVRLRDRRAPYATPHGPRYEQHAHWTVRRDLLGSGPFARDFVVETEQDGTIYLRFGDGRNGARPDPGTIFLATYRTGSGPSGAVGPGTIAHVVSEDERITGVNNPLPATGGAQPESLDHIRTYAPQAFSTQERSVTPGDYEEIARRFPDVQNAVAELRWKGSWDVMFVYVQRAGGRLVDAAFTAALTSFMENYRLAGDDFQIVGPHYVPLDIALRVRIAPHTERSVVRQALGELFSNVLLPGGGRGFFYPGNFTFGESVYLSQIVTAAMTAPGVVSVEPVRFQRLGQAPQGELAAGRLDVRANEVARVDNNAAAPGNGMITFTLRGGL